MNEELSHDEESQDMGYFSFMEPGEKTVFTTPGNPGNIINGRLVLTNKKIFFYFYSNIIREKKFIVTYPYIVSAQLKEGIIYSNPTIENKKESIRIKKLKKKDTLKFYGLPDSIIKENKKDS